MESESKNKYFFIIRHGERLDHIKGPEKDKMINKNDPGLSESGLQMALHAGDHLKQLFEEYNISKVKIMSSPMIRCVQTAKQISTRLGINKVILNNGFVEWMTNPWMMIGIDEVEVRTKTFDEIKEQYLGQDWEGEIEDPNNDFEELSKIKKESYQAADERIVKYSEEIIKSEELYED